MRRKAGLTQVELAEAVGMTRQEISRIEHGHKQPRPMTQRMLSAALYSRILRDRGQQEDHSDRVGQDKRPFVEASDSGGQNVHSIRRWEYDRDYGREGYLGVEALEVLESKGPASLCGARVIVRSRSSADDCRVMDGMNALALHRAFPHTFDLVVIPTGVGGARVRASGAGQEEPK